MTDIYLVNVARVWSQDGGLGSLCLMVTFVERCASEAAAEQRVRWLTRASESSYEAEWKAPEFREFFKNDRYFSRSRYFVGLPPLGEFTSFLTGPSRL